MYAIVKTCLVIFLFNILTGCSSKTYPTGNYQQTTVTIDGDLNEWSRPLRFGSSGGQMQYNVTNDNDNIYISLETHDEATAIKILRSGVNIYIDPSAGENKKIALSFPLANSSSPAPTKNINAGGSRLDKNDFRQSLLVQAVTFNTTGFKNMENRDYDVSDKSKISVGLKSENNNGLTYEAAIPLKYIFENNATGNNSSRNISVGIVINAMKGGGENHTNSNNTPGRGGGMHGGGGHGGGRGGGTYHKSTTSGSNDPGTQTPDRTALFKQDTNWYKFKLAVKK